MIKNAHMIGFLIIYGWERVWHYIPERIYQKINVLFLEDAIFTSHGLFGIGINSTYLSKH